MKNETREMIVKAARLEAQSALWSYLKNKDSRSMAVRLHALSRYTQAKGNLERLVNRNK